MASKLFDGTDVKHRIAWSAGVQSLADQHGERLAVSDASGNALTYSELCCFSHQLAQFLRDRHDVTHAMPVATLLPNTVTAVWASYGAKIAGVAEVSVGWSSTSEEIAWYAKLAQFRKVLTLSERVVELEQLGLEPIALDVLPHDLPVPDKGLPAVDVNLPGRILFTSGTTGKPKGVLYSHDRRWKAEQLLKASLPFVPVPGERIIVMTPFVHGTSLLTYAWLDHGAHVVLLDGVNEQVLSRELPDSRVRAIFAPPTVLAKITTIFEGQTFDHVKCVFTGTQPLTQKIYQRARKMFGPVVRITYGKSECVNPITVLSTEQTELYYGSESLPSGACVGYPAPGVEIKIHSLDSESGEEQDGEVWLRAAHMSLGMITEQGFVPHGPDGWHQTGDLGHFDEAGRLVLTGRVADVIKTGGYRVNPDEIEALLTGWSSTMQICVTSLPSDYWGEIIVAVAENPQQNWEEVVKERVSVLSRHKQPRLHAVLDALPRNPQGKVNRRQVRAKVLERCQLIDGPYPKLIQK